MSTPVPRSLAKTLIQGSGWAIAIRWGAKFLGIINLAICARILTPADYGLVNMAMVVIGLSQVLVEFGLDASLIRNQKASSEHYDTAWSLKIIQTVLISAVIFIGAPIAAHVYADARVMPIMFAVGTAGLIGGFQNIYVVNFRKDLDFRRDFLYSFIPRLASFAVSITAVLLMRTYWGLVLGICAGEIARMLCSYSLAKRRAKWSLHHWREMTAFSFWYLLDGFAQYSVNHLDRAFIGAAGGSTQAGLYGVGREVAALPSTELVLPIGRALMPTLAKLNADPERQIAAIQKAITGVSLIAVPLTVGFALVADEFVRILFGTKWLDAVPLVAILSLSAMTAGFRSTAQHVLVVLGHIRVNAAISWAYAATVLGLMAPVFWWKGVVGVAWLYCAWSFFSTFLFGAFLHKLGILKGWSVWTAMARVVVSAALMYAVVWWLAPHLGTNPFWSLTSKTLIGGLSYATLILVFWLAAGRPDSSERLILQLLTKALKKNTGTAVS